ncbi:hypothetical protein NQ314_019485 [Rhamnusium bicolor]|uniref:DDE Tnp4 domain-containing protein n=1 Tax=Rhamnusium bicolor TaxID=1586634 RepID=A0AAV8WNU0_9CUCU|nr:hypothetical protein NQ314_019485 [Rhamnusium bicolor]
MDLGYLLLIRRPRHRRRPPLYRRILAIRSNKFDMDNEIFISLFRISKAMTSDIILLLNNALVRPARRHNALPVGIQEKVSFTKFLHSAELPRNSWLVGDNGYPVEHCLLTPFRNPNNDIEERYNIAHRHTRNFIERVFGILKLVWRILHDSGGNFLYKPSKVIKIIICCLMLHNIRIAHNFPEEYNEYDIQDVGNINPEQINDNVEDINFRRGEAVRQQLVHNRWY